MQHSVKEIGRRNSKLSKRRDDNKLFNYNDFLKFASDNKKRYSLIESGEDLLVSTWDSDDLVNDYKNNI